MLKRLLAMIALSSLFVSLALADDDVLALVTKGKVTSNSAGVTKLSLEDKMQVKGGYGLLETDAGQQVFTLQNLNTGTLKLTQIGVVVGLDGYELENKVSCGFGHTGCSTDSYMNKQGYDDYMSVANQNLGEYLAVTASKTTIITTIGSFSMPQVKFSTGAMVVGVNSNGTIYKIRSATATNRIASDVLRNIGNDLNRILYTNY